MYVFCKMISGKDVFFLITPFFVSMTATLCIFLLSRNWFWSSSSAHKKKTEFVCQSTTLNNIIVKRVKSLGDYEVPWWYNNHLFSLCIFSNKVSIEFQREFHFHSDGSCFVTDTYPSLSKIDSNPKICLLVPGLGSTKDDPTVVNFVITLAKSNIHTIVLGARGLDSPKESTQNKNKAPIISNVWHPGFYHDGIHILQNIRKLYPRSKIFLAGFSAGSNIISNILIHNRGKVSVAGVFCCCINFCYLTTMINLENESGLTGKIYSRLLALQLKHVLRKNLEKNSYLDKKLQSIVDDVSIMSDFDGRACKDIFKFNSKEEQHECFSGLKGVINQEIDKVPPILLLQPEDDPLHQGCVRRNVPASAIVSINEKVIYMETSHGNHIGFVEGSLYDHIVTRDHQSYTYPAKVCGIYFDTLFNYENKGTIA